MKFIDDVLVFIADRLVGGIAAILVGVIFMIVNVEIMCRYAFNISTLIADEYCGYLFAIMVYAGLSGGLYHDKLIKIDLPGAWSRMMNRPSVRLVVSFVTLLFNSLLLYAIWQTFYASIIFKSRSIQASRTLLAYPQGAVFLVIALLFLVSLCLFLKTVRLYLLKAKEDVK